MSLLSRRTYVGPALRPQEIDENPTPRTNRADGRELSLGAAFVTTGEAGFRGATPLIREALDLGLSLVDTSADYGDSEAAVGEALRNEARPVIISTKIGPRSRGFNPKDKKQLRKTFDESLRLLRRDSVDILMIHEPSRAGQIDWSDDHRTYDGPIVKVLSELKEEGKIGYTGLGGTTAYEMVPIVATGFYDVLLTAFNYSILWREAAMELLPEARRQNMGILLASPTQQGWLAKRYDAQVEPGQLPLAEQTAARAAEEALCIRQPDRDPPPRAHASPGAHEPRCLDSPHGAQES